MSRTPLVFAIGLLTGAAVVEAVVLASHDPALVADKSGARRLDAIEGELHALGAALADRAAPLPTSSVAPTLLADSRVDEVLAQLAELQTAVARLAAATAAASESSPSALDAAASAAGTVEVMPEKLPDTPANMTGLLALRGRGVDDLSSQYVLWTYDQVGEAFGRPTRIRPSPGGKGIKYYYDMPEGGGFVFWFVGGKVVGAFWDKY
ncbi:MAG TPA: hypothetical protein VFY71_02310 [Planctomycetota bacterium]|nr:hypothetical protein [Planctomycetota bacterium]